MQPDIRKVDLHCHSSSSTGAIGGSDTHTYDTDANLKWSNAPYACVESLRKFRTTGRCESIPSL